MFELKLQNWSEPAIVDSQFILDMAMAHNDYWFAQIKDGKVVSVGTTSKICKHKNKDRLGYDKGEGIQLSRVVTGKYTAPMIDHKDRNPLNNRLSNLRLCNSSQNNWNRRKHGNFTSKYKGVYWNKALSKWHAQIKLNYKKIHIGYYLLEIDAAKSYNKKAQELFGEFAYLNPV